MNYEAFNPMSGRPSAEDVTGENTSLRLNVNGTQVKLTPRQFEVFELRAMGFTEPEIADKFKISHQTVKNHSSDPLKGARDVAPIDVIAELITMGKLNPEKLAEGLDFTRTNNLTERSRKIFNKATNHASWHKSYKQISKKLKIGEQTLKNNLNSIFQVVGVPNILRARVFSILKRRRN